MFTMRMVDPKNTEAVREICREASVLEKLDSELTLRFGELLEDHVYMRLLTPCIPGITLEEYL
jgi:hypothetical protein